MKCKALDYWELIDNNWQEDASVNRFKEDFNEEEAIGYNQMGEFIDNSYVFFGRDGGDLYEAIHNNIYCELKKQYSDVEIAKMLGTIITNELELDNDNNIIYKEDNYYIEDYWQFVDGIINNTLCDIQIAYDIGGKSAIKELKQNTQIDNKIYDFFLKMPTKAYKEKELYGDDKMSKPFWTALSELKLEDEISVYWIDGMMYVNDENDGQASTNTSLYQAYRFAVLIQATIFDYTATDEEIKELSEQLLDLIDEDWYRINVWEYFDDIADDFKHLTGVSLSIDDKRAIVCSMTEMDDGYDLLCSFGSATYIAKTIWNYVKGNEHIHIPNKNGGFKTLKGCDNKTINQLADKYLQSDEYDLRKFATELHKECQYKMDVPNNFDEYLVQSSRISHKCYALLGYLLKNNINYKQQFLVGYIDWFDDYEENERYIYCHIDSSKNEIYFKENRKAPKSAYLHDIAFPHLVADPNRIQKDIEIKFTEVYIDDIIKEKTQAKDGMINDGYTHCHMYGTVGKYTG